MYFNDQVFYDGNKGKAFLLLHGISSGCAQMAPMAKMINDYGYAVHNVNVAGHGTYPQELLRTSWEDMVDKAMYDIDMLKRHFDDIYVSGLSLGGALTLAVAINRDDLAGIAPVSAPIVNTPDNLFAQDFPEDQVWIHRDLGGKVGIANYYHIHYEEVAVHVCDEFKKFCEYLNTPDILKKITCPAFVAQAKDDAMVDPVSSKIIYDQISSAKKTLYNPVDGGHNLTFTEGRFELMKNMAAFFEMTK